MHPTQETTMSETPTAPAAHAVRIDAQPGNASISIDGHLLPRGQVVGYVLEHDIQQALPALVLHTRQPDGIQFEGLATVAIAEPTDHATVIAGFLQSIDAAALQRAALDRPDLEDDRHSVTEAILRQLTDWAQGRG